MRQVYSSDPLLLVVRTHQKELLDEAAYDHMASEARQILGSDGHPLNRRLLKRKKISRVTIWRRTAWSLGKAAFSLGMWLAAR